MSSRKNWVSLTVCKNRYYLIVSSGELPAYAGGPEYSHCLLEPLEILSTVEDHVVREAVRSTYHYFTAQNIFYSLHYRLLNQQKRSSYQ